MRKQNFDKCANYLKSSVLALNSAVVFSLHLVHLAQVQPMTEAGKKIKVKQRWVICASKGIKIEIKDGPL